jgi:hypothetical protein
MMQEAGAALTAIRYLRLAASAAAVPAAAAATAAEGWSEEEEERLGAPFDEADVR